MKENVSGCFFSEHSVYTAEKYKARLLASSSPHIGGWLHAPLIASVGLRLSDEAVRVAVVHTLVSQWCARPVNHTLVYVYGEAVIARGLHGLACRTSGPRHQGQSTQ